MNTPQDPREPVEVVEVVEVDEVVVVDPDGSADVRSGADVTEQLAKDAGGTGVEQPHSDQVDTPEQLAKDAGDPLV